MTNVVKLNKRTLSQNDIFHALVDDIAKARPVYATQYMTAESWKALLIVSHAIATREKNGPVLALVPDLEGEGYVQLRESSAHMSKERASSLIEYTISWAALNGIPLRVPT